MADTDPARHPLLQQPLHVFNLPLEIVDTLSVRTSSLAPTAARVPSPVPNEEPRELSTSFACNVCLGATFTDVQEQRVHFKSDWHRYNVKTRMSGKAAVTEEEFGNLVDELNDSISGSESSDDSDASSSTSLSVMMKKQPLSRSASPSEDYRPVAKSALIWFQSSAIPVTQFGIYSSIFEPSLSPPEYVSAVKELQDGGQEGKLWTLFMTAGGHFAGMVVRVKRPSVVEDEEETRKGKKKKAKPKPEEMEIVYHKTFHRYTTRRKQGGSQSLNDEAKGKAKSAGAQLRRYGEQALRDDIRELMSEWSEEIDASERIFIRASTSNKRIFWGYDGNVIDKGDPRIRTFPFPTRRPTLSELTRCLQELTRVKISHLTDEALRAVDDAYLASLPKPKPIPVQAPTLPPKPIIPKLTKEEELERDRWRRLIEMIRKGRLEPLKAFWERDGQALGGVDAAIPEWAEDSRGLRTLLQVACSSGQEEVAHWLLEERHADPTIAVPSGVSVSNNKEDDSDEEGRPATPAGARRTAYDLAPSRGVRNVFRRCAYAHPDWWDWLGAARVPSALSPEMEAAKEGKKNVRRRALKERLQAREKEREEEQAKQDEEDRVRKERERLEEERRRMSEHPLARTAPQKLGGVNVPKGDGLAGLTPEMRARIERERRARAAEARLKG